MHSVMMNPTIIFFTPSYYLIRNPAFRCIPISGRRFLHMGNGRAIVRVNTPSFCVFSILMESFLYYSK